jgi:hypothetical protein
MGMGNADFWVSKIIEDLIPMKVSKGGPDVFYPLDSLLSATGLTYSNGNEYEKSIAIAGLETRMFDSLDVDFCKRFDKNEKEEVGMYNGTLVSFLEREDYSTKEHPGPLRALVRNWFEFLDSSGTAPGHTDILETCKQVKIALISLSHLSSDRGNFTPKFYPQRFCIKDDIVGVYPDVLALLLNTVLHRYHKAGVGYIEFSVSAKYVLKQNLYKFFRRPWSKSAKPDQFSITKSNIIYVIHVLFANPDMIQKK